MGRRMASQSAANERQLHGKIVGHGRALGLVFGEKLVAEGGARGIEDHGDVIGLRLLDQLAQHVGEKVGNFGGEAGGTIEAGHGREKGAEDETHGVDEEKLLCSGRRHPGEYSKRLGSALRPLARQ